MKRSLTIIVSLFIISLPAFSQNNKDWLNQKFKAADSVILVSHEPTAGILIVDEKTEKALPSPKLIIAGKPNYKIVKERQVITGLLVDTLIKILNRPFKDSEINATRCFIPHHAIFIIKNGKTSYLDICFGCRRFETSKDMEATGAFDNRKWTELENFFLALGFKYELGTED